MAVISSVVWPTQVRCATGSMLVSRAIALGDRDGAVAGGAARAVGDRHEGRAEGLELGDRLPELLLAGLVLGREELEGEGAVAAREALAHAQVPSVRHAQQPTEAIRARPRSTAVSTVLGSTSVTTWDPAPFRDQVQQVLDAFLDDRAAELAPLGPDAGAPDRRGAYGGARRQALPRGLLPLGLPRPPSGGRGPGGAGSRLRVAGDAARQRAGPRRLHGRLRHPPRPPGDPPAPSRPSTGRPGGAATPSSTAPLPRSCSATSCSAGPATCCATAGSPLTRSPPVSTSSSGAATR